MVNKAIVVGANGKMGRIACSVLSQSASISTVIPVTRDYTLNDALGDHSPRIAIELTDVDSVYQNSQVLLKASIATIVGASGLTAKQIQDLDQLAKQTNTPCLVVPNFSIAAALMNKAARAIAPYLNDCEIIEYHHTHKKDAPSATSIDTAQQIKSSREKSHKNRSGHLREACDVSIHSVRSPGVLAKQDVIFAQAGETLTISLNQISRQAFAPGIRLAVDRILTLSAGIHFGMEAVFEDFALDSSTRLDAR